MSARFQTRKRIDFSRVAEGLKGPGIDTRTWLSMARIEVDPDATVWDPELGWLCDVTLIGGPLDGDNEVMCRWATSGQGNGVGEHHPPRQGALVIIAIPEGDTNACPTILGYLHAEDPTTPTTAPVTVNGTPIDEVFASRTHIYAFPGEDLDAAYANVRLTGQMVLGVHDADQPFARGTDLADALDALADAIAAFTDGITIGIDANVAFGPLSAAGAQLKSTMATFKSLRSRYLSTRIRGT